MLRGRTGCERYSSKSYAAGQCCSQRDRVVFRSRVKSPRYPFEVALDITYPPPTRGSFSWADDLVLGQRRGDAIRLLRAVPAITNIYYLDFNGIMRQVIKMTILAGAIMPAFANVPAQAQNQAQNEVCIPDLGCVRAEIGQNVR
jgi:hypothetical protein